MHDTVKISLPGGGIKIYHAIWKKGKTGISAKSELSVIYMIKT